MNPYGYHNGIFKRTLRAASIPVNVLVPFVSTPTISTTTTSTNGGGTSVRRSMPPSQSMWDVRVRVASCAQSGPSGL